MLFTALMAFAALSTEGEKIVFIDPGALLADVEFVGVLKDRFIFKVLK